MPKIVYNGSAYRIYGDLPAIGARAPDVSLVNTDLQAELLSQVLQRPP
jgi:peroxiredoxin